MTIVRSILLAPPVLGIMAPLFLKFQMYTASENCYQLLSAICHQASLRCFWIVGAPMGICARCSGIYIGLFLSSFSTILNHKWKHKYNIALLFIFPIVIEKIYFSSFAATNTIRFIVGMLAGFGVGAVFFSIFNELLISVKLSQKEAKQ